MHLSRGDAEVSIYAPDVDQMHVIDHTKGEPMEGQTRWVDLFLSYYYRKRFEAGIFMVIKQK